ncbi:MAG: DoxX family membrane protein [Terriglobales bacterium]
MISRKSKEMAGYAAAKGVPQPELAVQATGGMMLLGGVLLALGVKPKIGALIIAGFLAGVSPVMHNFWSIEDPNQKMNDMINFVKNMALLGAVLTLTGYDQPMPASIEEATTPRIKRGLLKMAA